MITPKRIEILLASHRQSTLFVGLASFRTIEPAELWLDRLTRWARHGFALTASAWVIASSVTGVVPPAQASEVCNGQSIVDLVSLSDAQLTDSDQDLIPDAYDNCLYVANQIQHDSDQDGFGEACDFDIGNNGVVDIPDLTFVLLALGTDNQAADFNNNGIVDLPDLLALLQKLGTAPGPSGLSCAGNIPCPGGE